jgi:hypothetical protein
VLFLGKEPNFCWRHWAILWLAPIPLPPLPADRVQSFQTLFVSIKWLGPAEAKKEPKIAILNKIKPHQNKLNRIKIKTEAKSRELLLKGKALYIWPPCTNYLCSITFDIENIFFYKTNYLNGQVPLALKNQNYASQVQMFETFSNMNYIMFQ